jgi:8-amino-7-oxononanoate synthase
MKNFLPKDTYEKLVEYSKRSLPELPLNNKSVANLLDAVKKISTDDFSYAIIAGSFAYGGGAKGMSDIDFGVIFKNSALEQSDKVREGIIEFIKAYKNFNLINGFVPDYLFPGEYMTQGQVEDAINGRSFRIDKQNQRLEIPVLTNDDFLKDYERWFQVWLTLNAFGIYFYGDIDAFVQNKVLCWKTIILYLLSNTLLDKINESSVISLITSSTFESQDFKIDPSYEQFELKESIFVKVVLDMLVGEKYLKIDGGNYMINSLAVDEWKKKTIMEAQTGVTKKSPFLFTFEKMIGLGDQDNRLSKPYLIKDLNDSYDWLNENHLEEDDLLVDQLPNPEMIVNGKKAVSFCSNNYLGLAKRKEILEAAQKALMTYGNGTCESRRLGGDLRVLEELEKKIAEFKGTESAIIFATGLLTNVGTIPSLTDSKRYCSQFYGKNYSSKELDNAVILSDEKNHRSIQMGIKLSHTEVYKYKHCDVNDLHRLLKLNRDKHILVITDGVFSMDGDLAPLDKIVEVAKKFGATIMVDDAHGTGVFGKNGRGTPEHFGVEKDIHIKMGTLSKAFGGLGGFVAADEKVVKMLKITSSGYYFTSSLPADQAAGLIKAFEIVESEPQLRENLWQNIYDITKRLKFLGFDIPKRFSCIIPIRIGNEQKSILAEQILLDEGVLCSSVRAPAVAPGMAQLRITVSSPHTAKHIDKLIFGLAKVAKKLDIPLSPISQSEWNDFKTHLLPNYIKVKE